MGRKRGKGQRSVSECLTEAVKNLQLDSENAENVQVWTDLLVAEVEKKREELLEVIENELDNIKSHIRNLTMEIPMRVQHLKIQDILAAGGTLFVDEAGLRSFRLYVPVQLFQEESANSNLVVANILSSAKKHNCFRPALDDISSASNKKGLRSTVKRQLVTTGTTPSTQKGKKAPRLAGKASPRSTVNGSFRNGMSCGRVTRSTVRKGYSSIAHVIQPARGNPNGGGLHQTPRADQGDVDHLDNSLVNPKTPGGNRLFKKPARFPKADETIVYCSKTGTPLIIDQSLKASQNTNKDSAHL